MKWWRRKKAMGQGTFQNFEPGHIQGLQAQPSILDQMFGQIGPEQLQQYRQAQAPIHYQQQLAGFLPQALNIFVSNHDPTIEQTAKKLLERHLTDEQKASWEKYQGFWVTAKSGTRYWLDGGRPRGLPQDGPPQSFCINSMDDSGAPLPRGDQILAQKLLLETDEERFLKTANAGRL